MHSYVASSLTPGITRRDETLICGRLADEGNTVRGRLPWRALGFMQAHRKSVRRSSILLAPLSHECLQLRSRPDGFDSFDVAQADGFEARDSRRDTEHIHGICPTPIAFAQNVFKATRMAKVEF